MAICKSATRYDSDSYYETIVDEETEDVTVRGTNNGEPVEYSLGGGVGSMMVATINIDYTQPDNITIDKTFNELKSALQTGVPVYARAVMVLGENTGISTVNMITFLHSMGADSIRFEMVGYGTELNDELNDTRIASITETVITLLPDNTLSMNIASADIRGE